MLQSVTAMAIEVVPEILGEAMSQGVKVQMSVI